MTQQPIIIFASDTGWRLGLGNSVQDLPSTTVGTPAQIAAEIAAMLGSTSDNVTFAIPGSWCLSATVSLTGIPARNRRTSLLYRLELLIPLTAEDLTADYILNEPDRALAICTSTPTIKPFIDAIEAEGILIQSVIPASLLTANSLLASQNACDLVILQSSSSIELFNVDQGKIAGWYIFPAEPEDLRWHVDQLSKNWTAACNAVACNVDATLIELLKTTAPLRFVAIDNRSIEQVVCAAIAAGQPQPINLRQGGLAPSSPFRAVRTSLNEAMLTALLLIFCICGAACWRATKLEQLADSNRDQQRKLFLQLYPGHMVPTNIVSRLRSEDRALETGNLNDANSTPPSALPVLKAVLAGIDAMPPQVRFQLDDLKVDDQKLYLDGTVKTRADLTNVVDALQQTSQIKLDPPQTEQAERKGLHITLSGVVSETPQK